MSERIHGVVFDMNGTIVDDIPYHFEAWRTLAEELGVVLDDATLQSFNGLKNEDILAKLAGPSLGAERAAQLIEKKETTYRAMYRPHLALVPGARELFERLQAAAIPVAFASSAPPENRAMNSLSCAIFFSRCALLASTEARICVLASTMSS